MTSQDRQRPETFEAVRHAVTEAFARGVDSAKHGFHTPVLITSATDGTPTGRTVVLRAAEADSMTLTCHTDRRAPKIDELSRSPATCWVFYDAPSKIQVRAFGGAAVHTDDALADDRWRLSSLSSRRCYLAPAVPGDATEHPSANLPGHLRDRVPTDAESQDGRQQFAVIRAAIQRMDVLLLHRTGHVRVEFTIDRNVTAEDTDASWIGTWLEP